MRKMMAVMLTICILLSASAACASGWRNTDGGWWYEYESGGYAANQWIQDNNWYYFDGSGWMATGWRQIGAAWYYFAGNGAMVTGWQQISGTWYYFTESGAMVTGWHFIGEARYFFAENGAMVTGWQQIGGAWYYFTGSGAMITGWQQIDGAWYYFAGSGAMTTGWQQIGGARYYFTGSGAMVTGWQQIDGVWHYFTESGAMATDWVQINGSWYRFTGNGAMITGWCQISGTWHYFAENGAMVIGWQQISGDWYYFDGSGAMATGWKYYRGARYWLKESGAMVTGWEQIDGAWYFFNEGGAMQTGWVQIGNDWYYMARHGAMVTSNCLIDGTFYAFDESGKCLGEVENLRLVVWSFTNELQGMIEKYYAPNHPEIEFDFQMYPTEGHTYTNKLDTMLGDDAASDEAPDIVVLEAAFVKHYVESDMTGDLKGIGFTDEEMSTAFPVMVQIGQNADGVQKALSWQSTPGVLMYRASLAEKYLGVTSPEEFQAKVADWDAFLATAKELSSASGGLCKMVTGYGDIWNAYLYQRDAGWVVDGKLNIDDQLLSYEEMNKTMYQDDLTQKGGAWSEVWFAGMKGMNETLCYFLPTWGLQYTLKGNCGQGTSDSMTEEELATYNLENGNGTYGDWRITGGPVAYSWGGSWMGINAAKASAASEAKKTVMHDLIYNFSLNEKTLEQYAKDTGDFVGSANVMNKIAAENSPDPFLGGQNSNAVFVSAASKVNGKLAGEYDDQIGSMWNEHVTGPYARGEKSLDACVSEFKTAVREALPAIAVE